MVGFPGETDEEFEELLDFLASGAIDHLGVFEFSPEAGTRAHHLRGSVPREVASARARLLVETMAELSAARGSGRAGQRVTVLVDSDRSARTAGQAWESDGVVLWDEGAGPRPAAGTFARARITGGAGFDLIAVPLSVGFEETAGTSGREGHAAGETA